MISLQVARELQETHLVRPEHDVNWSIITPHWMGCYSATGLLQVLCPRYLFTHQGRDKQCEANFHVQAGKDTVVET